MTSKELRQKFQAALDRKQYDLANEYFLAALEAGADEMDKIAPGSGQVWRDLGRTTYALTDAMQQ